jgi:hypothetical protein
VTLTPEEFDELCLRDPALAEEVARAVLAQPRMGREYSPHDPQPKQLTFLGLDCLEALYGGAAGGGKSDALLLSALEYVHEPGYAAILFRRTYTELALPEAIMARSHEWLAGTDAHWNGTDKQWRFPSGATLSFGYLDGPRDHFRYQSAAFQFIGWDELTQFAEAPYRYLFSRCRRPMGSTIPLRVRAATNPGGVGHEWVKARWRIPDDVDFSKVYDSNGRVFVPARKGDNRHLDQDAYDTALAELDTVSRAQLESGRWIRDTSGLVYGDYSDLLCLERLPELPGDEQWTHILACDFGVKDPTAFVVLAFNQHEPNVYIREAEQWTDLSPTEAAEKAIEWSERYGGFERLIGDTGGLGKAFEVEWRKRFHLPLEAADKQNKLGYIKLLNGDLKHRRVRFVEAGTLELCENLRGLPWSDETAQREHPDFPNHLTDALLYGWRAARHWNAQHRKPVHAHGSPEWFREQDESARKQVFAKVRERLKKQARKATTKARVRAIAKAGL